MMLNRFKSSAMASRPSGRAHHCVGLRPGEMRGRSGGCSMMDALIARSRRAVVTAIVVLVAGSISLDAAPTIATQPQSATVAVGDSVSIAVNASGSGVLTYQWRKFGVPMTGMIGSKLTISAVEIANRGFYDVVVTDGGGAVTSNGIEIRVRPRRYPDVLRRSKTFAPVFEQTGGHVLAVLPTADGGFFGGGSFKRLGLRAETGLVRFNSDGSLDAAFHSPLVSGKIVALARQTDGKLVVGGDFVARGSKLYYNLIRLNVDGSVDSTFELVGSLQGVIGTIAIQPDGKILVGGVIRKIGAVETSHLVRLNRNGSLDSTFARGIAFGYSVSQIGLQSNGSIVVAGWFPQNLVRLLSTGILDSTFAHTIPSTVTSLLVMPDDRLLVGTSVSSGTPTLRRLAANGAAETTFALSGSAGAGQSLTVDHLALQSDGKILATTRLDKGLIAAEASLFRFNADGSVDMTFPLPAISVTAAGSLAVTTDGSIIVGTPISGLIRLQPTGVRDTTIVPEFFSFGRVTAILPAPGNAWLVGGYFGLVDGVPAPGLVRLTRAGVVDPSFSTEASVQGGVTCLAQQGDGRILAGGLFSGFAGAATSSLLRFEANGQRDATYAPALPAGIFVQHLAVLANGSALISGETTYSGSFPAPNLVRVSPAGLVESDFGNELILSNGPPVLNARPNGSAYVAGFLRSRAGSSSGVVRLTPAGTVDLGFSVDFSSTSVTALTEQSDGRIVVGGYFSDGASSGYRNLQRLNADGSRDLSFQLTSPYNTIVQNLQTHDGGDILSTGVSGIAQADGATPAISRFNGDGSADTAFSVEGLFESGSVTASEYTSDNGLLVGADMIFDNYVSRGLTLLDRVVAPVIVEQPAAPSSLSAGGSGILLSVLAEAEGELTYQWQKRPAAVGDGDSFVNLDGANERTLHIPSPQRFHSGAYRVIVSGNGVTLVSVPVTVSIADGLASPAARLLNLSTRALCQTGDNVLIPGFVISGTASKKLLIRAVGPTLGLEYFVAGALPNPRIVVKRHNSATNTDVDIATNDNWGAASNFAAIKQTAARVFAFPIPDESLDAALLLDLEPGQYTAIVDGVAGATGVAIAELYDADADGSGSRLINISNRGYAGVGGEVMIPGFVVSTEGPKTFLIRAVGPTIAGAPYNVPGTMVDPKLIVYRTNPQGPSTEILNQDNWGENPDAAYTAQIATQLSAFPLASGSKDAAFVVTLPPGGYTVHGKSADGSGTGVMLVEVYVVE